MSIAEQITKSAQNLSNARKAILLKGGNVGDNPAFNNLASEIESIPSGDANYVLVDDTDTAYRKSILPGAAQLAKLKSIGGMTYKRQKIGKNLLPSSGTVATTETGGSYVYVYPSLVDDTTGAIELEAGEYIITLNLTADAPIYANFIAVVNINGEYANGAHDGTDAYRFTLSEKTTITSLTCDYELVTDAETITVTYTPSLIKVEYELVDSKVTEIINHGANLYNGEAEFTLNGAVVSKVIFESDIEEDVMVSWKFDGTAPNGATLFQITQADGTTKNVATNILKYTNAKGIKRINLVNWCAATGRWYDIQINYGTTATEYKPHREPITYAIPEALQGSGKGVNGYADTADFERSKNIKRCDTNALTGDELWEEYTSGGLPSGAYCYWSANIKPNGKNGAFTSICNQFENMDKAWDYARGTGVYSDHHILNRVYFVTDKPTVAEWKAYLAEQYANGTPVTLTYILAEPIETDLPEDFSNLIEVEGGGSLEFVNEYSNAVPSHISYLRRIV